MQRSPFSMMVMMVSAVGGGLYGTAGRGADLALGLHLQRGVADAVLPQLLPHRLLDAVGIACLLYTSPSPRD